MEYDLGLIQFNFLNSRLVILDVLSVNLPWVRRFSQTKQPKRWRSNFNVWKLQSVSLERAVLWACERLKWAHKRGSWARARDPIYLNPYLTTHRSNIGSRWGDATYVRYETCEMTVIIYTFQRFCKLSRQILTKYGKCYLREKWLFWH